MGLAEGPIGARKYQGKGPHRCTTLYVFQGFIDRQEEREQRRIQR